MESIEVEAYVFAACSFVVLILLLSAAMIIRQSSHYQQSHLITRVSLALVLIVANILFMAGSGQGQSDCATISIALQYTLLSTTCWFFLEAWQLARFGTLALQRSSISHRTVIALLTVGWLVPSLVITIIVAALFHQDIPNTSPCWIRSDAGPAFWFFSVPMFIILTLGLLLLLFHSPPIDQTTIIALYSPATPWRYSKKVCVVLVLGLAIVWIMAAALAEQSDRVWQALFSLANSCWAVLFFYAYALIGQRRKIVSKNARSLPGSLSRASQLSIPPPDRAWTYDPFSGPQSEQVTANTFGKGVPLKEHSTKEKTGLPTCQTASSFIHHPYHTGQASNPTSLRRQQHRRRQRSKSSRSGSAGSADGSVYTTLAVLGHDDDRARIEANTEMNLSGTTTQNTSFEELDKVVHSMQTFINDTFKPGYKMEQKEESASPLVTVCQYVISGQSISPVPSVKKDCSNEIGKEAPPESAHRLKLLSVSLTKLDELQVEVPRLDTNVSVKSLPGRLNSEQTTSSLLGANFWSGSTMLHSSASTFPPSEYSCNSLCLASSEGSLSNTSRGLSQEAVGPCSTSCADEVKSEVSENPTTEFCENLISSPSQTACCRSLQIHSTINDLSTPEKAHEGLPDHSGRGMPVGSEDVQPNRRDALESVSTEEDFDPDDFNPDDFSDFATAVIEDLFQFNHPSAAVVESAGLLSPIAEETASSLALEAAGSTTELDYVHQGPIADVDTTDIAHGAHNHKS